MTKDEFEDLANEAIQKIGATQLFLFVAIDLDTQSILITNNGRLEEIIALVAQIKQIDIPTPTVN